MNHALISKYYDGVKREELTPEYFRKLYNRIIADYHLEKYANSRNADAVCIRQAIMKIARTKTSLSLKQIGSIWGKDHSTIIHGLDNVKKAHETNDKLYLNWESKVCRYFKMRIYDFTYQLILSDKPCDIFKHFGVDELHGLSLKDCQAYNNTNEDAYIAGLCNLIPNSDKTFIFLNTSRMNNCKEKMALIFHETMHLSLEMHNHDVIEQEEQIISWAEAEAIKIFDLI